MNPPVSGSPAAIDLRALGQPQQQMLVAENPDGTRSAFPFVAVAFLSDAALQNLVTLVTAAVIAALDARGILAPPPPEQENHA